jgi:hypothetical protein
MSGKNETLTLRFRILGQRSNVSIVIRSQLWRHEYLIMDIPSRSSTDPSLRVEVSENLRQDPLTTLSLFDLESLGDDRYRFWWGYRNVELNGGLLLVLGAKLMQTVQEHRQQIEREQRREQYPQDEQ